MSFATSRQLPPRGAFLSGADGSSPAHGRQQAGESRVGLRSAESRGSQASGFEGKEIFKDHGSLNRSLVTFCRRRKSLALRRNRRRSFRDRPPNAERKQRGGGEPPPYMLRVRQGVSRYWKRPGPTRAPAPTANLETFQQAFPRPDDHPRKAPHRWGGKFLLFPTGGSRRERAASAYGAPEERSKPPWGS